MSGAQASQEGQQQERRLRMREAWQRQQEELQRVLLQHEDEVARQMAAALGGGEATGRSHERARMFENAPPQPAGADLRRALHTWAATMRQRVPEEWQRRFALAFLHAQIAVPSLKLIMRRVKRRLEHAFSVTLPDPATVDFAAVPGSLWAFLLFFALRHFGLVIRAACLAGLGVCIFWEDCDICCETRATITMVTNRCGHRCCRQCLASYLSTNQEERISRMRHARTYNIRCFGGCEERLDRALALAGNASMRPFLRLLRRRERLIARCPEGTQWVECPQMSCVGVGYRGQQRIMCFLCEHQWEDENYGLGRRLWNWMKNSLFPERIDGIEYRCCPHCGAAIVKNGGCDNMRCTMCDGIFRWGALRNTTQVRHALMPTASCAHSRSMCSKTDVCLISRMHACGSYQGVIPEHAPPSTRQRTAFSQ